MRLTLRALIAYLDQSLEPADAKSIGDQIAASEAATNLMHRVRDVMHRLRLGAPKLLGKGLGHDPNSISEYLDYTLTTERVPELEKICLESDVQLAELASVHQILALVLGEPVTIDPDTRQRMYGALALADTTPHTPIAPETTPVVSAPSVATSPAVTPIAPQPAPIPTPTMPVAPVAAAVIPATAVNAPTASPVGSGVLGERRKPEVPDYLRDTPVAATGDQKKVDIPEYLREPPRKARSSRFAAVAAAVVLAIVATLAIAFPEKVEQIKRSFVAQKDTTPGDVPSGTTVEPAKTVGGTTPVAPPASVPMPPDPIPVTPPTTPSTPAPGVPALSQPQDTSPPAPSTKSTSEAPAPPPLPATAPGAPPSTTPMPTTSPATPTPGTTPSAPSTAPVTVTPVLPAAPAPTPPAAPVQVLAMGQVTTSDNVLVRMVESGQGGWQRLAPQAKVMAGDRVLSLPTYQSSVSLSNGLGLQLRGGSLAELVAPDSRQVPGLIFHHGNVIVSANGQAGAELRFGAATRQGLFVFLTPDAAIAISMQSQKIDGNDPQAGLAPQLVDLYIPQGEVRWTDAANPEPVTRKGPVHIPLGVARAEGATPDTVLPAWLTSDDRTDLEKLAAPVVEKDSRERPLTVVLKELADDRRVEVRLLAVQCLMRIGEFEALVASLRDESQVKNWDAQIDALREAIWMDPTVATRVRQVLEAHRGPTKGSELFRMLAAYSTQQLRDGDAAKLVKALDHEDLDMRVLAFWNLRRVSGKTLTYRPEYTQAKRRPLVVKWEQLLATDQLIPKPMPMP